MKRAICFRPAGFKLRPAGFKLWLAGFKLWLAGFKLLTCLLVSASVFGGAARSAHAAEYWQSGVRTSPISVCFVGDAVTSRPVRVKQVVSYIKEYEYSGGIHWVTVAGNLLASEATNNISALACPASTPNPRTGSDSYAGDIRVVLFNTSVNPTGLVPGNGCPMFLDKNGNYDGTNNGGSWSNAPSSLTPNRSCMYNLKLGDDPFPTNGKPAGNPPSKTPYLNHTLHEFGHALGLSHEHSRNDVDKSICSAAGFGGSSNAHITPYDRYSVMHYQFLSCGINGNYDNTGLSSWDQLAIHIMYPEANPVAETVGRTVIRDTEDLHMKNAWEVAGANMGFVALVHQWSVDDTVMSFGPELNVPGLSTGEHTVVYSFSDFLGHVYVGKQTVHVLTQAQYDAQVGASAAVRVPIT